jgi:hypothetical protein
MAEPHSALDDMIRAGMAQHLVRAQAQIAALADMQVRLVERAQARQGSLYQLARTLTPDTALAHQLFTQGLEALRADVATRRDDLERAAYEASPAYAAYVAEQRAIGLAMGRMERREDGDLEMTMTAAQYAVWVQGSPEAREALRTAMEADVTQHVQAQGMHGLTAVLTPNDDTAFYVAVPFVAPAYTPETAFDPTLALRGPDLLVIDTSESGLGADFEAQIAELDRRIAGLVEPGQGPAQEKGLGY